jgi:hypothetical protein
MPAIAETSPLTTKSRNLVRSIRTPEKRAASLDRPIAKMPRPAGVKCSTTAKTIASTTNSTMMFGIGVPGMRSSTRLRNPSGKSPIRSVPTRPTARPRNRASVPIVTASEGRPTTVMKKPLIAPAATPTSRATTSATPTPRPAVCAMPKATPARPAVLATERSISPVTMMSVIGSAMSSTAATFGSRYWMVSGPANPGTDTYATM